MHRFILAIIFSKALASGATYPHEVLRTRLQNQHGGISSPGSKYKGLWHAFRTVLREEGGRGLYGGFGVNLVRTVPSSLVTILGFEAVKSSVGVIEHFPPLFFSCYILWIEIQCFLMSLMWVPRNEGIRIGW